MAVKAAAIVAGLCVSLAASARQEQTAAAENQLENYTTQLEEAPEDDAHWQQLQGYTNRKISLNTADAAILRSLGLLSPLQITYFLRYRQQMGALLSIYELQAIPGFDEALISQLLLYVEVGNDLTPHYRLRDYLKRGDHTFLFRYGRQPETSRGFLRTDSTAAHYLGSPDHLLVRYRYNFPQYMSWGVVMEKDAGEQFFKGAQRYGFDFYSVHLFVKNYKRIKALALGDFTVNMGQGLLNWQTLAFGKGPVVMQVKREGELLKPYASAGEYNFYRGGGMTIAKGRWQATAFISLRALDGSVTNTSGYHRSITELEKRHSLQQFTTGGNITVERNTWKAGINFIQHQFSRFQQRGTAPYQLFAFERKQLTAVSTDYEANWRNIHLFGEGAMSDNRKMAILQGMMATVSRYADIVVVYRNYDRAYQSFYADAWGEFYRPVNENGIYTGISIKVNPRLKIDGYADMFRFPWLQYRLSAPGGGRDLLVAMTYTPDKQTEVFIRYNDNSKLRNAVGTADLIKPPDQVSKQSWRLQIKLQPEEAVTLKSRVEVNRYKDAVAVQRGFLLFQEVLYECPRWPLQLYTRYSRFVTDGSESRMYAIASGMLYEYAVSQFSGKGYQYQMRVRWKPKRRLTIWLRYQQTIYEDVTEIGSGWDKIQGNKKSLIQLQVQQLLKGKI
jgi:DNA uptake protein ComE-like DNA-binding protein